MKVPSYTFSGGVISKGLRGRVDLNKYATGLKEAHNMVIGVEGGAEKRYGTYLVGNRKLNDKKSKLVPWRIADDDSYMLEFAHNCIRFIRFGGYIAIPSGHVADPDSVAVNVSGFMEVPTPYDHSILHQLKFTYANDILYIAHNNYAPRELRRIGLYDWAFVTQDFDPHPNWVGTVTATYTDATTSGDNYDAEPEPVHYKVSATLSNGIETKPSSEVTVSADLGHRRTKVDLTWPAYPDAIQYTIYKGANGIFGFIGYTEDLTYTDKNFAPSYDVVPVGNSFTFPSGEWPRTMEFYKQRMGYAAPTSKPQNLTFSKPLIFNSLAKSTPSQNDDAIEVTLVGRNRHTINHMVQLKKFIIFTDTAEWVISSVQDTAGLTPATIDPVMETFYGSHPYLRPLAIGERILFVQNTTGMVLDMGYEFTADAFKADELTRLARDLFKNKTITAWDYSTFPQNILPAVMSDGSLNLMTYVRQHEIWAWTTASTKGKITDVAIVPEISQDGIYFQVERVIGGTTQYFIERMNIPTSERIDESGYMDCALSYKKNLSVTNITRISDISLSFLALSHDYVVGTEVQLETASFTYRGEVTSIVGDLITIKPLRNALFSALIEETGESLKCTSGVIGLDHLEGEEVIVLADGKVVKHLTVSAGVLALPYTAARITVGLHYSAWIETLNLDFDSLKGTYNMRTIDEIRLHLRDSRSVLVGTSNTTRELVELAPRTVENMYDPPAILDGVYEIPSHVGWGNTASVIVASEDPLPLNILNVVPEIVYGN